MKVEWKSWFVCQYINWNLTFKVTLKNLVFDFFSRYDCVYLYEFHVFLIGFILLNAYLIDRVRVMPCGV